MPAKETPTIEIYTLSLHDALPISGSHRGLRARSVRVPRLDAASPQAPRTPGRSEEHTSELQSQSKLVCRLLLENKNPAYAYELAAIIKDGIHQIYTRREDCFYYII